MTDKLVGKDLTDRSNYTGLYIVLVQPTDEDDGGWTGENFAFGPFIGKDSAKAWIDEHSDDATIEADSCRIELLKSHD